MHVSYLSVIFIFHNMCSENVDTDKLIERSYTISKVVTVSVLSERLYYCPAVRALDCVKILEDDGQRFS